LRHKFQREEEYEGFHSKECEDGDQEQESSQEGNVEESSKLNFAGCTVAFQSFNASSKNPSDSKILFSHRA